MEVLEIHTGAPTVNWEDNTSCISVVEAKIITTRVKHIDIPACFLQQKFDNGLFITKYEKSSFMPADMFTKSCSGTILSRITKWITGFILYPTIDTEQYQFMRLHEFILNYMYYQYNILRVHTLT